MTNGQRDLLRLQDMMCKKLEHIWETFYQFVTDKYEACVLFLLSLLGNKAEESLLCLVIRAVRNPEKMTHSCFERTVDRLLCFFMYCITCAGGTGARFSWTWTPEWPPRLLTRSAPPDIIKCRWWERTTLTAR